MDGRGKRRIFDCAEEYIHRERFNMTGDREAAAIATEEVDRMKVR